MDVIFIDGITELETSDQQQWLLPVLDDLLVLDSGESAGHCGASDG
jgi:hypothetical protein